MCLKITGSVVVLNLPAQVLKASYAQTEVKKLARPAQKIAQHMSAASARFYNYTSTPIFHCIPMILVYVFIL